MKFKTFNSIVHLSRDDICREFFLGNRNRIKIKKERVAVKNLVKIFDATLAISNRKGFHMMSLRDLSSETGLSMGALYSYFSSKDELLDMILQQGGTIVVKVLMEHTAGIDNPRDKLSRAIRIHLYLSEVIHSWFYFMYMETKNLLKEKHKNAIRAELFTEKIFMDIIDQGVSSGCFLPVNTDLTASVIKAMLQDWYLKRWKYSKRKVSVEGYARFLIDFIESYLIPHEN